MSMFANFIHKLLKTNNLFKAKIKELFFFFTLKYIMLLCTEKIFTGKVWVNRKVLIIFIEFSQKEKRQQFKWKG